MILIKLATPATMVLSVIQTMKLEGMVFVTIISIVGTGDYGVGVILICVSLTDNKSDPSLKYLNLFF